MSDLLKSSRLGADLDYPDALYQDAPRNADSPQAIAWMRKVIRPQTANEAAFELLGEADNPPYTQSLMLVCAVAHRMQWPVSWANVALESEWKQARQKASAALEMAETAARRLIFQSASGSRVIAAAMQVFNDADMYPSREAIQALCRRVAQGSGRGARRVGSR